MSRAPALVLAAGLASLASGCTGTAKEGKPPARLDGTWFGSWTGEDEFGFPIGSGFYFVLEHDEDGGVVSGTAFSSVAGEGAVTGSASGTRFTLDVAYAGGDVETYVGREVFGTVDSGEYDGTLGGTVFGGDFGMFPAELARSGTNSNAGQVSGQVTTGGGTTPVAGAVVSIGAGEDRQETVTNANGDYSFPVVLGGPRVVVVNADGGGTKFLPFVVNGSITVTDIDIAPASVPVGPPLITLDQAIDGLTVTNSVIFAQGDVSAIDAQFMVASINGGEYLVPLEAGGLAYPLILSRGVNTIVLQATSQNGVTERTLLANANVPPQKIRVTMVWDRGAVSEGGTANDQDMHIWLFPPGGGGAGQHASFVEPSGISNGVIDIDNTFGFGPENFTMLTAGAGNYYVAVNYFAGTGDTRNIVRISLNEKTPDEKVYVFGPYILNTPNGNGEYPVTVSTPSWWRVADIVVDGNGLATIAPADTAFALPD